MWRFSITGLKSLSSIYPISTLLLRVMNRSVPTKNLVLPIPDSDPVNTGKNGSIPRYGSKGEEDGL
jgi:hypothetical protein